MSGAVSCANTGEAVELFDAYVGERGGELLAVGLLARWAGAADQQQGRHGDRRVAREVVVERVDGSDLARKGAGQRQERGRSARDRAVGADEACGVELLGADVERDSISSTWSAGTSSAVANRPSV